MHASYDSGYKEGMLTFFIFSSTVLTFP